MHLLNRLNQPKSLPHRLTLTILITLSLFLTLSQINSPQITFTDELLFEEASYNMATTGSYLIPQIDHQPWLEKPPLYFWLTAPIFHLANLFTSTNIFDLSQSLDSNNIFLYPWIRRFWTLIAFQITLIFTYKFAKHLYTPLTGLISYLLLLLTPLWLFSSTSASLDLTATALITISLYTYISHPPKLKSSWKKLILTPSFLLLATCISAAFLTRSFLALTPLAVILLHQLITKQKIFKTTNYLLLATFLLMILPWHLLAYLQHPELFTSTYLSWNLIQHSLELTPGYSPTTPFYYLILLLTQIPWTYLILIPLIIKLSKSPIPKTNLSTLTSHISIPHLWLLIPLLALTLSSTRHPWYFIQVLPPIAILAAPKLQHLWQSLQTPNRLYQRHLFELSFLSFTITMLFILFIHQNRSASTIQALQYLTQTTSPNQTIYNLNHGYLPHTALYHPRPIQTINPNQLNQLPPNTYLYISDQDLTPTLESQLQPIKSFPPGSIYKTTE